MAETDPNAGDIPDSVPAEHGSTPPNAPAQVAFRNVEVTVQEARRSASPDVAAQAAYTASETRRRVRRLVVWGGILVALTTWLVYTVVNHVPIVGHVVAPYGTYTTFVQNSLGWPQSIEESPYVQVKIFQQYTGGPVTYTILPTTKSVRGERYDIEMMFDARKHRLLVYVK